MSSWFLTQTFGRIQKVDPLIWGPILLRVHYRNPPFRDLLFGSSLKGSGKRLKMVGPLGSKLFGFGPAPREPNSP